MKEAIMPSPFPGMDPYLEGSLWTTVHAQLAAEIARQLAPKIRPKYLARTEKRFLTKEPEDVALTVADIYPDVGIAHSSRRTTRSGRRTVVTSPPLEMVTIITSPVPHLSVEIRDAKKRELVTAIELLSPTNKRGEGRKDYLEKRRKLLSSTAHLVEIDLLRTGRRLPMRKALPQAAYFVFVGRAEKRPKTEVWPIGMDQPLPVIPIPLLAEDPDVQLDLQLALTTIYDLLGYDLEIDYSEPPEVALSPKDAAWAAKHLRKFRARNAS